MALVRVERVDHLGLIAAVIKDVGLMDMINTRLVPAAQEAITAGEAMAGMLLNGLGCANRPLSLPPQLFAHTPLALLFRAGVRAERCNRFQRGRTLDEGYAYGGALLCSERALPVGVQEGIALRFRPLDPTSFSLSGDSVPESDEQAIPITHGSSKDHRPAWKQAVLERLVAQEGGVPLVRKRWEGKASETQMFQERAAALLATLQRAPTPRYVGADATVDTEAHAANLRPRGFLPRMPGTLKLVAHVSTPALAWDTWPHLDDTPRDERSALCHDGMAQRWRVVASPAALERAEASGNTAGQRASHALDQPRLHLPATRLAPPEAAHAARAALAQSWQ